MTVKEYLKEQILLFDGAMGSYYAARNGRHAEVCELANLHAPELVREIHREYVEAGAKAVKTNTFGVNRRVFPPEVCAQIINAGWELAGESGAEFVFADIGPMDASEYGDIWEEHKFIVDCFLALGAENFLFETQTDVGVLGEIAEYIKEKNGNSFVAVSFAAMPDGFTRAGLFVRDALEGLEKNTAIDAVGLNCVSSSRHMADLAKTLPQTEKYHSFMPNAGYPTVVGHKVHYGGSPDYYARQMRTLADMGARILGGCCGTTPEHIEAVSRMLKVWTAKPVTITLNSVPNEAKQADSRFYEMLCDETKKPFAIELDPPELADAAKFMAGAKELKENGADIITIADCPIARARMDSSLLACKIRRELDIEALPHMTCRDRNLNAIKALLLGLCAEDIHNVLTVTGDPIPSESRDEVKSVFNFNSRKLASYIRSLGETTLPTPFHVYGALNLNARNFRIELNRAVEKEKSGICGFLTQPVLTAQALENLKLARETLSGKILGGIIPIVSHRNACFMNSEVAGITVDEQIISLYEGADRERGEELAVKISAAVAKEIAPYIDGYYLITPFGRTALMARIMQAIREQENE